MLHEITKGMDNASEVINENFESLEVQTIRGDGGICEKHADGRMVCYSDGSYSLTGNNLENPKTVTFPTPFHEIHSLQHAIYRSAFDFTGRMISRATPPSQTQFRHAHEGADTSGVSGSYVAYGRWK